MAETQATTPNENYPGGSRERVSRAGAAVRSNSATAEDLAVIERWRAAHRAVLNSFQALLRNRTRGRDIVVAQRHKRRNTIFGKLTRQPNMMLHRMDDVAGCRLIFPNLADLYAFRSEIHKAKFKHQLRNDPNKYDYIAKPKPDGYRGIHDVYKYDVRSPHGVAYKGLQIELQYRTIHQHAWATCVEVVGFVTSSNPKFKQGDDRYSKILTLASEMISRCFEFTEGPQPNLTNEELIIQFQKLDHDLQFMEMLRTLEASQVGVKGNRTNIILIFSEMRPLEIRTFKDTTEALLELFAIENDPAYEGRDIVLVQGNRKSVRDAFRNYFSDASDFVQYIDYALVTLQMRHWEDIGITARIETVSLPKI